MLCRYIIHPKYIIMALKNMLAWYDLKQYQSYSNLMPRQSPFTSSSSMLQSKKLSNSIWKFHECVMINWQLCCCCHHLFTYQGEEGGARQGERSNKIFCSSIEIGFAFSSPLSTQKKSCTKTCRKLQQNHPKW